MGWAVSRPGTMTRAVLSLGGNLGDRAGTLRRAIGALTEEGLVARSMLYETPPWGPVEQPPYLNAIAVVRGDRDAAGWLALAHQLEQAAGRTREVRWGARTLDVDVVTVTEDDGTPVLSDDPALTLPHPRAAERAFVLVPWLSLEPTATLPGHGRVADLVAALPAEDVAGVVRWEQLA
jgi:2-amino-4-hydroxy-6-hydroxymethyldihydropteridine diphosphokinase